MRFLREFKAGRAEEFQCFPDEIKRAGDEKKGSRAARGQRFSQAAARAAFGHRVVLATGIRQIFGNGGPLAARRVVFM